jgi:glycosyltransferase involved in cell wall biosynthesis
MAVLEAMAAGTPVIVSDADAMKELWSDYALILPCPIRMSEWHMAVEDLLADPVRWAQMSERGLLKASDLTWDRQATRYLTAMEA